MLYAVGAFPQPIAGFGPFLAALAVLGVTRGRTGVRALLRSMVTWRVPGRAYLVAVGLPVLLSGIAPISANLALGAQPSAEALAAWSAVPLTFLVVLLVPGLAGAWEEPGFRGYALSRLEAKYGAITGPLVLGLLWVVWHGPLFLIGEILWTDVFVVMAASVVIAFVFHAGRESVLVAMIFHAFNNAVGGQYASQIPRRRSHSAGDAHRSRLVAGGGRHPCRRPQPEPSQGARRRGRGPVLSMNRARAIFPATRG